jgi:predicted transcriptional regulator
MSTLQVRITPETHRTLRSLSEQTHQPMPKLLEQAVEELRRKYFFEEVNSAFARLKADPDAWEEELAERRLSEGTLADGLTDD